MTTSDATSPSTAPLNGAKPALSARQEQADFLKFLVKLALFVLIVRSFLFSPFSIPSESMQPRLLIGDYLVVNKMAYGYSRYSLPFGVPLIPGRIFSSLPQRGDVAVFKAPPRQEEDYIKRVIGLPGDRIQVTNGAVSLNGKPIDRVRVADAILPVTDNLRAAAQRDGTLPCFLPIYQEVAGGRDVCRYPRYRETLPNGRSYDTLDVYEGGPSFPDTTQVYIVPKGHLFLMGDNRDRSADSRFPAVRGRGIGFVPVENLVGKAMFTVFSTDGAAQWYNPLSWASAARWGRIGEGF